MSLNWEDERYVRWYTRNTPEWSSLSWQARGLFGLIMREVDRAGVLAVGKLGLKGIAVSVRAPWREIEPFMAELLADGCVRFRDGKLLIPNFLEAQEARQSDRARSQASRERRKAMADGSSHGTATAEQDVTFRDDGVTFRDDSSHAVTGGHTPSHGVTPSCAVPNLTIPVGVTDSDDSEPEDPFPVIRRTYAEAVNAAAHRFHDPNRWANPEDSEALLWAWRDAKAAGLSLSDFLLGMTQRVQSWVKEAKAEGTERYTSGWRPTKFAAWIGDDEAKAS